MLTEETLQIPSDIETDIIRSKIRQINNKPNTYTDNELKLFNEIQILKENLNKVNKKNENTNNNNTNIDHPNFNNNNHSSNFNTSQRNN